MKFPYGISDFNKIIKNGYFYCDRTDRIRLLEAAGDSLLFLRPRRFGKSLLLSMLANYYDVANEVMMNEHGAKDKYEALVHGDGLLKTLFKTIKSSAGESLFDRTFMTGVSPIIMSDITSGYNIAKNIYLESEFNELCGFTEKEISDALKEIEEQCDFKKGEGEAALDIMREYYNGYSFDYKVRSMIYNPTLALYFF